MQVDFVTVVFQRDLNLLKLQARSIALYVPKNLIKSIIIICRDEQSPDIIRNNIVSEYKDLQNKVTVYNNSQFINEKTNEIDNGWFIQQIIKLRAYKVCTSKYHIVLDAKNHFISPIDESFFFKNEKPLQVLENCKTYNMRNYIINSLNVFENYKNSTSSVLYYTEENAPYFQTLLTPVIFKTEICKEIDSIMILEEFINSQVHCAEFALYAAYLKFKNIEDEYIRTDKQFSCTSYSSKDLENKLQIIPSYSLIGISSSIFNTLTENQKNAIIELWINANLCYPEEAVHLFELLTKTNYSVNSKGEWAYAIF